MLNEDFQFMKAGMGGFNFNDMSNFHGTKTNNFYETKLLIKLSLKKSLKIIFSLKRLKQYLIS